MRKTFKVLFAVIFFGMSSQAQIKIGDNPTIVNNAALLELESTNKGILMPRISLTGTQDVTTIPSPTTGLLIYNISTMGVSPNNVAPGFYYYDGMQWKAFVSTTTVVGAESKAGQFLRFGIDSQTINASTEVSLRFVNNNSTAEMGNNLSGTANFISTFEDSEIGTGSLENVALSAGLGTPARTTDRVKLSEGVYRITLQLVGKSDYNPVPAYLNFKLAINNNEYSYRDGLLSQTNGNTDMTGTFIDYVILTSESYIDFTVSATNKNWVLKDYVSLSGGKLYRSICTIERLR